MGRKVKEIFDKGSKAEIKTERDIWAKTMNIAIEISNNGKPSGISTTEADYWIHVLSLDGKLEGMLIFDVDSLKSKIKRFVKNKKARIVNGGDYNKTKMVLLPIKYLFD